MNNKADIGVFGGSGFYSFLKDVEEIEIETPYGKPSDKIALAAYEGKRIAFLPPRQKPSTAASHDTLQGKPFAMKSWGKKILVPQPPAVFNLI